MELTEAQKRAISTGIAMIANHFWNFERRFEEGELQIDEDGNSPRERLYAVRYAANENCKELAAMLGQEWKPL